MQTYLLLIFVITLLCISFWFFTHFLLQILLWYGVPYVPTPQYKISTLLQHISLKKGQKFIDIWCGDGRIVEAVKHMFPEWKVVGIENSLYPYFLAKKRQKQSTYRYEISRGNFFQTDLWKYDVIYCYLLPLHMNKVWKKISQECAPWTLLYSNAFEIPEKKPKEKIHIRDAKYFYVYEV